MLPGVGTATVRQLLEIAGTAEDVFKMSKKELDSLFGRHKKIVDAIVSKAVFAEVEKELKFIEKNKIGVHFYTDASFPQRLNRSGCEDAPVLLYSLGDANLNATRSVSVVGTRRATPNGVDMTNRLVAGFNGENITVVSGLALGIDTAAHEAALANSLPTIAVLAHGLDKLYPPQNRNLAKRIIANGGMLLTEMRSGTALSPRIFPVRNRIIAALSDATVVVEASSSGGALITANIAMGYHRDLFAFPGRVDDKYSSGCNAIIASCKAMLIRNADDLFNNMGWEHITKHIGTQTTLFPELEGDEKTVYDVLLQHPETGTDGIREHCGLPLPKIATALLSLELKNLCRCLPGKIYKVI